MTFTLTLVNDHGVWQSSDLRLSDPRTGALVDDYSVKHVAFKCPDGSALLTYAGVGRVGPDHISDGVRSVIRGESYTVDQTLLRMRERATQDLGNLLFRGNIAHMFSVGAISKDFRGVVQIRNFSVTTERGFGPLMREFVTAAQQLPVPSLGVVIAWPWWVSSADLSLLQKVAPRRPRKPKEFFGVLAGVNARTAERHPAAVSRHCVLSYMPRAGGTVTTESYGFPPGAPNVVAPFILYGIDMTDTMRALMRVPEDWKGS